MMSQLFDNCTEFYLFDCIICRKSCLCFVEPKPPSENELSSVNIIVLLFYLLITSRYLCMKSCTDDGIFSNDITILHAVVNFFFLLVKKYPASPLP